MDDAASTDHATPLTPQATAGPGATPKTDDQNAKAPKRRAAKACVTCRARKVRCDTIDKGSFPLGQCTNCVYDKIKCIVEPSKRRNRKQQFVTGATAGTNALGQALGVPYNQQNMAAQPIFQGQLQSQAMQDHSGLPVVAGPLSQQQPHHPMEFQYPPMPIEFQGPSPNWLKTTCPPHLGPDDMAYLRGKGAFHVPSMSLMPAILTAYLECVHPALPLLDVKWFINCVTQPAGNFVEPSNQVSMLLFQAVMFAGVGYVAKEKLLAAGYKDHMTARKIFFSRAVAIHCVDAEQDAFAALQASLLLGFYYHGKMGGTKDTWYWLGNAASLSNVIGLDTDPDSFQPPLDDATKKQRRVTWWCMCTRDRMVAVGMRRGVRVHTAYNAVAPLTLDDFDIEPLSDSSLNMLSPSCVWARNADVQRQTLQMFIEQTKLLPIIDGIIKTQYSQQLANGVDPADDLDHLLCVQMGGSHHNYHPKLFSDPKSVEKIESALWMWHNGLPEACKYQPINVFEEGGDVLGLHRNYLHAEFHTVLSMLLRPELSKASLAGDRREAVTKTLKDSANQIVALFSELRENNLMGRLLTTAVTVLMPPLMMCLLTLGSKAPKAEWDGAYKKFQQSLVMMSELGQLYPAAKNAVSWLTARFRQILRTNSAANLAAQQNPKNPADVIMARGMDATPPPDNGAVSFGAPPNDLQHTLAPNRLQLQLPLMPARPGAMNAASPPPSPVDSFPGYEIHSPSPAPQQMAQNLFAPLLQPAPLPTLYQAPEQVNFNPFNWSNGDANIDANIDANDVGDDMWQYINVNRDGDLEAANYSGLPSAGVLSDLNGGEWGVGSH